MLSKYKNKIRLIITILIVIFFVWFLILSPIISFKMAEAKMLESAKRYYELNSYDLPTGTRVKTLTLQDLYYKKYIKNDIYIPYTKTPCDLKESWVKVRRENENYKYYVNLKCGPMVSSVDNKGPDIKLNGDSEIVVSKGDSYKELGVLSVVDNKDGKLDVKNVNIDGKVNTNEVGEYYISYSAFDNLKNKTEVKRKVIVKEILKDTVKKITNNGYFTGEDNNYIRLSSMMFRIIGIDNDNVKAVAEEDVSFINYDGIDDWLENYYYNQFSDNSKKYLVKNKYCNMDITDTTLDTLECSKFTDERYFYIPSIVDINKTKEEDLSFISNSDTFTWLANARDKDNAYIIGNVDAESSKKFDVENKSFNYGIRPVITIKGDSEILSGDGSSDNPYSFKDIKKGKHGDSLNTRYTGEYVWFSNSLWRIISKEENGPTKIISNDSFGDEGGELKFIDINDTKIYNPDKSSSVGYMINNKVIKYLDDKYLDKFTLEVPIYKKDINYKKEEKVKKYSNIKVSSPNLYEMFSSGGSNYWVINSSKDNNYGVAISYYNKIYNGKFETYNYGVKPVIYLKKSVEIVEGDGSREKPYTIDK